MNEAPKNIAKGREAEDAGYRVLARKYRPKSFDDLIGQGASVGVGRVGSILGPLAAGFMLSGGQSAVDVVQYMAPVAAVAGIAVCALSFCKMGSDPIS